MNTNSFLLPPDSILHPDREQVEAIATTFVDLDKKPGWAVLTDGAVHVAAAKHGRVVVKMDSPDVLRALSVELRDKGYAVARSPEGSSLGVFPIVARPATSVTSTVVVATSEPLTLDSGEVWQYRTGTEGWEIRGAGGVMRLTLNNGIGLELHAKRPLPGSRLLGCPDHGACWWLSVGWEERGKWGDPLLADGLHGLEVATLLRGHYLLRLHPYADAHSTPLDLGAFKPAKPIGRKTRRQRAKPVKR